MKGDGHRAPNSRGAFLGNRPRRENFVLRFWLDPAGYAAGIALVQNFSHKFIRRLRFSKKSPR
jgi:hypothetical protein